jgi:hypothetical protein
MRGSDGQGQRLMLLRMLPPCMHVRFLLLTLAFVGSSLNFAPDPPALRTASLKPSGYRPFCARDPEDHPLPSVSLFLASLCSALLAVLYRVSAAPDKADSVDMRNAERVGTSSPAPINAINSHDPDQKLTAHYGEKNATPEEGRLAAGSEMRVIRESSFPPQRRSRTL